MSAKHEILIQQGADFNLEINWKDGDNVPIDLTGATGRMQVRPNVNSATTLLDLTSEITFPDPTQGEISINVSNTVTTNLLPGRHVYDLEIVESSGKVTRLLEGVARITPEVTR